LGISVVLVEVYHEHGVVLLIFSSRLFNMQLSVKQSSSRELREIAESCFDCSGESRDAEAGLAELLGCASLFSPETALETQQTATKSPPCQTAKMTFAWKAAGLT
jgi:hypothetical protein